MAPPRCAPAAVSKTASPVRVLLSFQEKSSCWWLWIMIGCDTLFDPSFYCRRHQRADTECRRRHRFATYGRILAEINHRTPPQPRRTLRASRRCSAVYSKRYVWLFGSAIQAKTAAMTDTYLLTQRRVKQQVFKQVAFINHSNWRKVESRRAAAVAARRWCYSRRRRSLTEPCSWI